MVETTKVKWKKSKIREPIAIDTIARSGTQQPKHNAIHPISRSFCNQHRRPRLNQAGLFLWVMVWEELDQHTKQSFANARTQTEVYARPRMIILRNLLYSSKTQNNLSFEFNSGIVRIRNSDSKFKKIRRSKTESMPASHLQTHVFEKMRFTVRKFESTMKSQIRIFKR